MSARRLFIALMLVLAIGAVAATTATAQTRVVYNSIQEPLPGNVASIDVWGHTDFGDGLFLASPKGTLEEVKVVLSSWACQSGNWTGTPSFCSTKPGTTFSWPITLNIYGVKYPAADSSYDTPTPTTLLGTVTQTFDIPYRPSASGLALCPANPAGWYDKKDKKCYNGLAVPIHFDLWNLPSPIQIPTNQRIIVTVTYNSTYFGPSPIGVTGCDSTTEGCPYDSLNVSASGNGPTGLFNGKGDILDWNGIFINLSNDANSCNGSGPGGVPPVSPDSYGALALNTLATGLCWSGYHPQIEVKANYEDEHE